MEKTKITKFYNQKKKSSRSRLDDNKKLLLTNENESIKSSIVQESISEKNVDSVSSPIVTRSTRSSARIKSKTILLTETGQSTKINDFFKSQTDNSNETEDTREKTLSFTKTLEKTNSSSFPSKEKLLATENVTKTKSPLKRRFSETISSPLSPNREKSSTLESSTTIIKEKEEIQTVQEKSGSSFQNNHTVRKKLVLGDDDIKPETESPEDVIKKRKQKGESDDQDITSSCELWSLGFSPLSKISRPLSPLPETPQKLREMRQAATVKPETSSKSCAINLDKMMELSNSPGPSQIDPNVIKARLSKCGKLEELKQHLMRMKELKNEHNQRTKIAKSPVKSPVKETKAEATNETPSSPNKTPAYERFKHLVLPLVPSLTLPHSYTVLEEFFKSTDTVVSMMFNRSEVCTQAKVTAAVQEMTKRNYKPTVLGQIKTVYPGAYEFKQEKGLPKSGYKYQGYQLTLTPMFDAINSKDAGEGKTKFTSSDILRRQKIFHSNLVNLVKKKHKVFLKKLNLSIPEEKLTRWHPRFRLDEVPDIEPSALPEPPNVKVYQTAKDVLEDTKKRFHPKVKTALENVSASTEKTPVISAAAAASNFCKEDLKGIPQGLLERIRAKEAQRLEEAITLSPMNDQKKKMLDRLPEISRILRNYFVTEKKPALLFEQLLERISESYKTPISKTDAENHMKLLLEVAPNWITVASTIKGKYLKLDKTVKLQYIHEKINQYKKKL